MNYVALLNVDNDIIIRGDNCCTTLQELYTAITETNTTEIEIRKEFADAYFTYSALCDFVENSASLFPNVRIVVEDTVYDTATKHVDELMSMKHPDELVYAITKDPSRIISTIQMLCKSYMQAKDDASVANNKIATMLVQIEDLTKQLGYMKKDYKNVLDLNNELDAKLQALISRVNYRYEKSVNPDEMFVAKSNSYNHVLYIKEISRVHYVDTLIYYMKEVLKTLYSVPVRFVVIEPYYAYGAIDRYPDCKPHWDLTYQDVYSGDILMAGYQPKLMKSILQDANHVNFLIVLDRGGYMTPHIDCQNTTVIYTVSDLKDLPEKIPKNKVISYDDSTLYIPYIDDFDKLSSEDKIQKYSSMKVMKELINYLEEVR